MSRFADLPSRTFKYFAGSSTLLFPYVVQLHKAVLIIECTNDGPDIHISCGAVLRRLLFICKCGKEECFLLVGNWLPLPGLEVGNLILLFFPEGEVGAWIKKTALSNFGG